MRRQGGVLLATLLLAATALGAGCLSGPGPPAPPAPRPAAVPVQSAAYEGLACENALLFLLVDYAKTDPYLPPGFHPRDPQEFLVGFPASFGSAAVLFLEVTCPSPGGNLTAGSIDVFVQRPTVPGADDARFDFYEVARYSHGGEFGGLLDGAGWPRIDGSVGLHLTRGVTQRSWFIQANASDELGPAVTFLGGALPSNGTTIELGPSLVRFWHEGAGGLASYEYDTVLDPWVGPGVCTVREGSPLAAFTGTTGVAAPLGGGDVACPDASGGSPVVATFPGLVLDGHATLWPGVHAG
jgi:hypothetical protein